MEPLERTFTEDPNRCLGVGPAGQCVFKAEPNSSYCRIHGGPAPRKLSIQGRKTAYELDETAYIQRFADRVDALGDSYDIRSLRNEVGILRATLERLLKSVQDDESLQFHSGEIIALTARIESLEKTSFNIEKELGTLMSIEEAKQLAAELLSVLFNELERLQKLENYRITKGKELVERLVLPEEIKKELMGYLEPLGIHTALENISDSFEDTVNGAGSKRHKK